MGKRGLSGVLVSILILLVAVVGIFIIASFLSPAIDKGLTGTSCVDLLNSISFVQNDYTCFSEDFTSFSIQTTEDVNAFAVLISDDGAEKRYDISKEKSYKEIRMSQGNFSGPLEIGKSGEIRTYVYDGIAENIKVFPIAKEGFLCSVSDNIDLNECSQQAVETLQSVAGGGGGGGGPGGPGGPGPGPSNNTFSGTYGAGVAMDSLANTHAGSPQGQFIVPAFGFVAEKSGNFTSFLYHHAGFPQHGYSNGTGGLWRAEIYANNATSNTPTGPILASKVMSGVNTTLIEEVILDAPVLVVQGQTYHIVFRNIDPQPSQNYFSVDNVYVHNPYNETLLFPKYHSDKLFHQYQYNGVWTRRYNFLPILEIKYQNQTSQGMSYDEIQSVFAGEVGGPNKLVREVINVSGGDRTVGGLGIRVLKIPGTNSPLVAKVKDSSGKEIISVSIPAGSISNGPAPPASCGCTHCDCAWNQVGQNATWALANFSSPVVLQNSQKYYAEFSSSEGTYWFWSIRHFIDLPGYYQGYNFTKETAFTDGYAQKTINGGVNWTYLAMPGNEGPINNLQFYFNAQ